MAARAQTGRFLSRDPDSGGDTDRLSKNEYIYAYNNPINIDDADGHGFWNWVKNSYNNVKKTIKKTYNKTKNYVKKAIKRVEKNVNKAINTVKKTYNKAKNYVKKTYNKAKNYVNKTVKKVVNKVKNVIKKSEECRKKHYQKC